MFHHALSKALILLGVAPSLLWITIGGGGCGGSGVQTNPAAVGPGEILQEGLNGSVHEAIKAVIPQSQEGPSGLTAEVAACLSPFAMTSPCDGGGSATLHGACTVTKIASEGKLYQYSGDVDYSSCGPSALNGSLLFQMALGPIPFSCLGCVNPIPFTMELMSPEGRSFRIGELAVTHVLALFEGRIQEGTLTGDFTSLEAIMDGSIRCSLKEEVVQCVKPEAPADLCAFSGEPFGECTEDADCEESQFCDGIGCCVPTGALPCQPFGPCSEDGTCSDPNLLCEEPRIIDGVEQGRCCIPKPASNVCPLSGDPLPDCDSSLFDQCPEGQFCSGSCCVEGVCELTCEQARVGFCDGPCPDPCAQADSSLICSEEGCCIPGGEPSGCTTCGDGSCELHETSDDCFFDCSGRGNCKLSSSPCSADADCPTDEQCLGGCCGSCTVDGCSSEACNNNEACNTADDCRPGGICDGDGCCGPNPDSVCGDGICDPYESCRPSDCPPSPPSSHCGDGSCDPTTETETCCDCVEL